MKYYRYAKCMVAHPPVSLLISKRAYPPHQTPPPSSSRITIIHASINLPDVAGTIRDMIDLAYTLIKAKHKDSQIDGYQCVVSKRQVQWYTTPSPL